MLRLKCPALLGHAYGSTGHFGNAQGHFCSLVCSLSSWDCPVCSARLSLQPFNTEPSLCGAILLQSHKMQPVLVGTGSRLRCTTEWDSFRRSGPQWVEKGEDSLLMSIHKCFGLNSCGKYGLLLAPNASLSLSTWLLPLQQNSLGLLPWKELGTACVLSASCRATSETKGAPFLKHPIQGEMFQTIEMVSVRFVTLWQNSPKMGTAQGLWMGSVQSWCQSLTQHREQLHSSTVWDKITGKAQTCSPSQENIFIRENRWGRNISGADSHLFLCPDKPADSLPACAHAKLHHRLVGFLKNCVNGENPPGCNRHLTLSPRHGLNWQMWSC